MHIVPLLKLRDCRQKVGLTQVEVAMLLGVNDASAVSRHEAGARLPDLRLAIAYQAILGTRIEHLFPGLVEEVTADVAARAASLSAAIRSGHVDQRAASVLRRLADLTDEDLIDYGDDTLF